jgi:hypothetical protein
MSNLKDQLKTLLTTTNPAEASRSSNGALEIGGVTIPKAGTTAIPLAALLGGVVLLGVVLVKANNQRNEGEKAMLQRLLMERQQETELEDDYESS